MVQGLVGGGSCDAPRFIALKSALAVPPVKRSRIFTTDGRCL
jgi:hypothetical protein